MPARPIPESVICSAGFEFEVALRLTESEARCLNALFTYGTEELLRVYFQLGTHYLKDKNPGWEEAMKTLGKKASEAIPTQLARCDAARVAFNDGKGPARA